MTFSNDVFYPPFPNGPLIGPNTAGDPTKVRRLGLPILVWDKSYENNKAAWDDMVHQLLDKLLAERANNKGTDINPFTNYDLYYGRLDPNSAEIRRTTEAAGAPGNADFRPYYFFSTNVNRLVGTILEDGPEFSIELINPTASLEKISQISQDAAEHFMRGIGSQLEQQIGAGVGSSLSDQTQIIPDKAELIFNQLREKEKEALVVNDMLTYCLENYKGRLNLSEAYRDGAVIGQEFVEIDVEGQDPKPVRLDPKTVSWIGPKTFYDTDGLDAISVHEMRTMSQTIMRWGNVLSRTGKKADLEKELHDLQNATYGNSKSGDTWIKSQADIDAWVSNIYSRFKYAHSGSDWYVGEQRVYFKVAKIIYAALSLDGKALTSEQMDDLEAGRLYGQERVLYEPAEEGSEGVNITHINILEQWKAVRLGDKQLVYNAPFPKTYRDPSDPANIKYNIQGYVSSEPCLVTLGGDLAKMQMSALYQLQKLVNMVGADAIGYDLAQKPDEYSMEEIQLTAREAKLYLFNSKQVSGDEKAGSQNHLKKIGMGLDEAAQNIMNLVLMLQSQFDTMCGVSPTMKGMPGSRQGNGTTDAVLAQGDLIQRPAFFRHQELEKQVMLVMANTGKWIWAANPKHRSIILQKFGRKIIELTKDLSAQAYGLVFKDGQGVKKEKDFLNQLSQTFAASGKITPKQAIEIYHEGNTQRALATLQDGLTAMEKIQAALQQQTIQAQNAQAQATQADTAAKMTIAREKNQTEITVAQIQAGVAIKRHDETLQFNQDKLDVNNSIDLQKAAADHLYQKDQANNQAAIQPTEQAQPPVQQ